MRYPDAALPEGSPPSIYPVMRSFTSWNAAQMTQGLAMRKRPLLSRVEKQYDSAAFTSERQQPDAESVDSHDFDDDIE
jgi:hypothetical protein